MYSGFTTFYSATFWMKRYNSGPRSATTTRIKNQNHVTGTLNNWPILAIILYTTVHRRVLAQNVKTSWFGQWTSQGWLPFFLELITQAVNAEHAEVSPSCSKYWLCCQTPHYHLVLSLMPSVLCPIFIYLLILLYVYITTPLDSHHDIVAKKRRIRHSTVRPPLNTSMCPFQRDQSSRPTLYVCMYYT